MSKAATTPEILTAYGTYFDFKNPSKSEIHIVSIAHALSHICRFTGHTREFYSVAQHCVMVSQIVPPELALAGLLHDAAEAYLGDVSKPLKMILPDYLEIEKIVEKAVFTHFKIGNTPYHAEIKRADAKMYLTERRDLMPSAPEQLLHGISPLQDRLIPLNSYSARRLFLQRFQYLNSIGTVKL